MEWAAGVADVCRFLMKSPVLRFAASLFPLLSSAGAVESGQDSGFGYYQPQPGVYWDRPDYGAGYLPDDDHRYGFRGSDGVYLHRDLPEWVGPPSAVDPYGLSLPGSYYEDSAPDAGYLRPLPSYGQVPTDRELDLYGPERTGQPGAPTVWGEYPDRLRRGEVPPAQLHGYRFRGDGPSGYGGWGAVPGRGGYQFRPLTEQERQRSGLGSVWRPRESGRPQERPRPPDPLPAEEAYGYEADSWFNRYFRGRP
jgi:hypothetical protein